MSTQEWPSPNFVAGDANPAPPPVPPAQRWELRPLAVGEILDRVFAMYRSHFWFFAGLSAVSAGVSTVTAILRLIYSHFAGAAVGSPSYAIGAIVIGIVQSGCFLIAYSLTLAATTSGVNAFYVGEPNSMGVSLRTARRLWLRCLGIGLWQAWSAMWVFLFLILPLVLVPLMFPGMRGAVAALYVLVVLGMLGGLVYGVVAYLRNSLAVPAAVIENLRVRAAMRRSKNLATGRIGRIFLLILLVYAVWVVAGLVQLPLAFLAIRAKGAEQFVLQGSVLAISFIVTTVVGPIAAIGLCLFYFDERVRREGFDIEMLLRNASPATVSSDPYSGVAVSGVETLAPPEQE